MRVKAVTACAGALTLAVVFTGSAAFADGITVDPRVAARGDDVTVKGAGCRGDENPDTGVTITSRALRTAQDNAADGRFSVTTTVPWDIRSGRFTVTAICKPSGIFLTGSIAISLGEHRNRFFDDRGHLFDDHPDRFPRTGGGGMADAASRHGPPMSGIAVPAGLLLLAGAAAVGGRTLVRSRARARGHR